MSAIWWLGVVTVLLASVCAWRSEDWWAMLAWKAGQRAGTLARARIKREEDRRIAALAGEHLIDEIGARWGTR